MDQLAIIEAAIHFIEQHLKEPIGLADVAQEVGYSYYHMTRIFRAAIQEPVGNYIARRRLYEASRELIYTNKRMIDIAIEYGFESSEAFSRAFKNIYDISPKNYRERGLDLAHNAKKALTKEDLLHIASKVTQQPRIVQFEQITLAGIRGATSLVHNRLPMLWNQYRTSCMADIRTNAIGFSICETGDACYREDGELSFSVFIGSPVADFKKIPAFLKEKQMAAGTYAVFTHKGSLAALDKTYDYIYGTWLMASKEELDQRDDFEVYRKDVTAYDDAQNLVEIYIPIKGS